MELKVCGLQTAGRYVAKFPQDVIGRAFQEAGVPITNAGGVFYGQCMQMMMEDAVEAGIDVVITVDSDSLFRGSDIKTLIHNLMANDQIDALAALQSRRGMKFPLFTLGQSRFVETNGEPFQVTTAHFGLTAIRVSSLKKVHKPWFWSTPTLSGQWTHDEGATDVKIDEDIYFWKRWQESGLSVYVDPCVSIGHYEEVVAMFDDEGTHRWIYPKEWLKAGAN